MPDGASNIFGQWGHEKIVSDGASKGCFSSSSVEIIDSKNWPYTASEMALKLKFWKKKFWQPCNVCSTA